MALIACKECGTEISTLAATCPKCGAPANINSNSAVAQKPDEVQHQPTKKKTRPAAWGCLALVVIAVIILVIISSLLPSKQTRNTSTTPASPNPSIGTPVPSEPVNEAHIHLKIQRPSYEYGYFKLTGIATNTGTKDAFSPTIHLSIYMNDGKTLLAEDNAWPAGTMLKTFPPGASAAFQVFTPVTGEPNQIRWEISVKEYAFDIQK